MPQNKYDEPEFFTRYSGMARSTGGLPAAGEWPAFRAMLPALDGRRVLDLGCGFGWHCRFAREQGATGVVGIDLSERMLERARADTADPDIEYRRAAIEEVSFPAGTFDVVLSSLAFHYVERFDTVAADVWRWLTPGGSFVFSVEHPIFTALAAQDWHHGPGGERLHWPVDRYFDEGERVAGWLGGNVVKYHRTLTTYVGALLHAGFRITGLTEPQPPPKMLAERPDARDELRRPMFLLIAAGKLAG